MQSPVSRDEGTFRSGTLLCSLKPEQRELLTPDNILVPIDLVGGRERHDSQRTGSDQVSVLSLLQALQPLQVSRARLIDACCRDEARAVPAECPTQELRPPSQ